MKTTVIALLLICGAFTAAEPRLSQKSADHPSTSCNEIAKALETVARVKVGMTRQELEQFFERDGGAQFPLSTRYVYPQCHYVKVEVEFQHPDSPPQNQLLSPNDVVSKVSKPYIEYAFKD